MGRQGEGEDKM